MEEKLGRYLLRSEVVHHIDGNPQNNHPDNLMVFQTNALHLKDELTGKVPNWTPEGFANMSVNKRKYHGDAKERQRQAWQRYDRIHRNRACNDDPQPLPIVHPTLQTDSTDATQAS
jgi:hypothetical protein